MTNIIHSNPEIMGGAPVFVGTRVPVQTLFDYIEGGDNIEEFMEDFPTVKKELIIQLLETLKDQAIQGSKAA